MKLLMMILTLLIVVRADDWNLAKESDGVSVYTRAVEGSEYLAFRGETVVEGSVAALVSILYDTPAAPEWLHQCRFAMTLEEKSFEENYIFQVYDLPFPVSDRQVILHSTLFLTQEGARLETKEANGYCAGRQSGRCRQIQEKALIAFTRSRGHYTFTHLDANRTKVVWQQHTEPGGRIPVWLVNMLVVDIPFNSLRNIQALVKTDKYRNMTMGRLREKWSQQYREHH